MGVIMSDASGQGFTASIVNSIPNYVAADRSTLGQINGATASIQYVKLVWGNSGNAYFVDDQGENPTPLPVSLNNADNYWLYDAVLNTFKTVSGSSAVNVNIVNAAGISFSGVTLSLGTSLLIAGGTGSASGLSSNLGVTFGGITVGPVRIRNFISNAGVTEAIAVTFGNVGGTVSVENLTVGSFNLNSGVVISGVTAGVSLPVSMSGGTLSGIAGTINTNLSSHSSALTLGVVLKDKSGNLIGHNGVGGKFVGYPVVAVTGSTFAVSGSVSITGTPSVTGSVYVQGTPSVTGSVYVQGTPSVTGSVSISGTPSVTGSVYLLGTPSVKIQPNTTGTTFSNVLTDASGSILGYSGSTFFGYPVQIVGGLSGISLTANVTIPASFIISSGTVGISGGSLTSLSVQGGTFTALNIGNISGGTLTGIVNPVSVVSVSGNPLQVLLKNDVSTPGIVQLASFVSENDGDLKKYLDGLTVTSQVSIPSSGITIAGFANSLKGMTASNPLGVTFPTANTRIISSSTLNTNVINTPSVTGSVYVLGTQTSGNALGVTLLGVGMSGDALKVSLSGVGITLGGITISGLGITFPTAFSISGGTLTVGVSGGTVNVGNTVNTIITNAGLTLINSDVALASTFGKPLKVIITKDNGDFFANDDIGTVVIGTTSAPLYITGWCGATAIGMTVDGTIRVMPSSPSTTFGMVLANRDGTVVGYNGTTFVGFPMFGVSGGTSIGVTFSQVSLGLSADRFFNSAFYATTVTAGVTSSWIGVTFQGSFTSTATVDLSSGVKLSGVTYPGGTLFGMPIYPTDNFGSPIGVSGVTVVGFPMIGVAGATAVGITFPSAPIVPSQGNTGVGGLSGGGTTFNTVLTTVAGVPIGYSINGGIASFLGIPVVGGSAAGPAINVNVRQFDYGGITFAGSCAGPSIPSLPQYVGGTYVRISPFVGLVGEPGFTVSGPVKVYGSVTLDNAGTITIGHTVGVTGYVSLGGTTNYVTGTMSIPTITRVVLVDGNGNTLGGSAAGPVIGLPIFGVSGATAIAVTFGAITFGSAGMGVTFGGITFNTTRTILVGSSFADGGGNLGIPVYGVQGATAVSVTISGGTVTGVFSSDTTGLTITAVSGGLPVIGVSGGQPIAVTFAAGPAATISLPVGGITIAGFGTQPIGTASFPGLTITGTVAISSGTLTAVTTLGTITNDVPIKPSSAMIVGNEHKKLAAITAAEGIIVTQKQGNIFARGLTLNNLFIGVTTSYVANPVGFSAQGTTLYAYYMNSTPVSVTKSYSGSGMDGTYLDGASTISSVPLKQGLWVQLTKWDLISHVLVGYSFPTQAEFERNAQVLTKEYQVGPVWAHALDQFRRFPGAIGNNAVIQPTGWSGSSNVNYDPVNYGGHPAQRQFVGVIEKPNRIFVPTNNAGEIYIQVKGDYNSHAIGSGFWDIERKRWSATTLYERSYYSGSFSGFTSGEPNLDYDGSVTSVDQYANDWAGGGIIDYSGLSLPSSPGNAMAQILASYQNNPFIRVWGY
jgi:hypothetical protein